MKKSYTRKSLTQWKLKIIKLLIMKTPIVYKFLKVKTPNNENSYTMKTPNNENS